MGTKVEVSAKPTFSCNKLPPHIEALYIRATEVRPGRQIRS